MNAFPAFFPLAGRKVVIVGAGEAAEVKARLFESSPAELVRIGEDEAAVDPRTYAGAVLAFIATADGDLAARAAQAARAAHVPVNVVDRPTLCDFLTPAVIDRGEVVAAIGSGGAAPLLAGLLRADIEARIPAGAGAAAALLGRLQGEVRAAFPDLTRRRAFLRGVLSGPAAEAAMAGDTARAEALLRAAIAASGAGAGQVRVIDGRGPADRLTLGEARLLSEADVLISDPDAAPDVIALARRDVRRLPMATADEIAALVAEGLQVVRLTGV